MSFYSNSVITYVPAPAYIFYDESAAYFDLGTPILVPFPDTGYTDLDIYISGGGGGGGYGNDPGAFHENTGGGGGGSGQQIGYIEVYNDGANVYYYLPPGNHDNNVTISLQGATSIYLTLGDGGGWASNGGNTTLTVNYLNGSSTSYTAIGGAAGQSSGEGYNGNGGAGYWGGGGGQGDYNGNGGGGAGNLSGPGHTSVGGGDGQAAYTTEFQMWSGGGGGPNGGSYPGGNAPSGGQNTAIVANNTAGGGGGGGNLFFEDAAKTIIRYGAVSGGYGSSGSGTVSAANGHAWSGQGGGGGAYRDSTANPGSGGSGFAVLYFHN
jgi:hypothetical protein